MAYIPINNSNGTTSSTSRPRRNSSGSAAHYSRINEGREAYEKELAAAIAMATPQASGYPSGGGYGGGGGGYGYGGGGYSGRKGPDIGKLTSTLNSQRDAAKRALPGYLKAYNSGISAVGKENAGLTKGYSAQIAKILAQLQGQARSEVALLNTDVGAQGGDLDPLRAQAGQNSLMLNNIGGAQDAYNLRLAQIMAGATSDRKGMGQAVNLAAQSGIDQAYMAALMQIQGMA
jgi:hypothetical protein